VLDPVWNCCDTRSSPEKNGDIEIGGENGIGPDETLTKNEERTESVVSTAPV
jgi:hypothetical protein